MPHYLPITSHHPAVRTESWDSFLTVPPPQHPLPTLYPTVMVLPAKKRCCRRPARLHGWPRIQLVPLELLGMASWPPNISQLHLLLSTPNATPRPRQQYLTGPLLLRYPPSSLLSRQQPLRVGSRVSTAQCPSSSLLLLESNLNPVPQSMPLREWSPTPPSPLLTHRPPATLACSGSSNQPSSSRPQASAAPRN